jgi:hypothetical protein
MSTARRMHRKPPLKARNQRQLLARSDVLLIALIPLLYLAINRSFGLNRAGDIDTWVYYGLAKSFWHQYGPDFYNDYYETRLPYIIPAALVFAIPSDRAASLIFSYLQYCLCAFSFYYVLRHHVSKNAALLTTVVMGSDIFFMRTVGWQYVDGGVLVYFSLTLAAITAAASATTILRQHALVAVSGFLVASMIIIHLGAAPLALAVLGYAVFMFDIKKIAWRHILVLILVAALGVLSCQVVYGILNMVLYRTNFLFEAQQVIAGLRVDVARLDPSESLDVALRSEWWLTVHIAVWIASAALIAAALARAFSPNGFQLYCMLAVFLIYGSLFVFDYFDRTMFLRRSGLYASFYLLLSYLFIGSMLPKIDRRSTALIIGAAFLLSLIVRDELGAEIAAPLLHVIPAWTIGLVLAGLIVAIALVKMRWVPCLAAPAAAVLLLPVNWQFSHPEEIYTARKDVQKAVGATVPYFAFSKTDPIYFPVSMSLAAAFTERAWHKKCDTFPDCSLRNIGQQKMVLLSSNTNAGDLYKTAATAMPEAELGVPELIYRAKDGSFFVYGMNISKSIQMPASKLYSDIGGAENSARFATEGTKPGLLVFGPIASLNPGHYKVTIKYQSDGEAGAWALFAGHPGVALAGGRIPDSHGATADIAATIDVPEGADTFLAHIAYSGRGSLSVLSLGVRSLDE